VVQAAWIVEAFDRAVSQLTGAAAGYPITAPPPHRRVPRQHPPLPTSDLYRGSYVPTILVVQKDAHQRRAWRQRIEASGHRSLGAPSLLQALTALSSMVIDALVIDLVSEQDVDVLRYVAQVRDLPSLVLVGDEVPPLPARSRAASHLPRARAEHDLCRVVDDLAHACSLGAAPPGRHPFRLPPDGVAKWSLVIRCDDPDDETIPSNEFAA
jgi:CheY-like chemotaxis protein